MAKTSKGIYYPYDYNKIADVPEDMKQMAESINKIFETKENDETAQNVEITELQNKVADLQQENTELSNNMPWNTVKGEGIHIEDSAKYSRNKLSVGGNLEETLAGNAQEKSISNPATISTATRVQKIRQFGKNLFDYITNLKKANNGLINTINADGSITTTGKITSGYTKVVDFTNITNILEDGQQYTLEQDVADINLFIQIRAKKEDGNSSYYGTNYSNKVTFTVDKNTYVQYDIYVTTATTDKWGNDSKSITNRYMLYKESDNVDDTFESYTETVHTLDLGSTELCKIGNVQDKAVYRNGKWHWEKKIKKVVLNGTESWEKTTASEGFYRYIYKVNTVDLTYSASVNVYGANSHFTQRNQQNHGPYEYLYIQGSPTGGGIYIQVKDIATVEELKTFLAEQYSKGTPVTVYYVLASAKYEDCTAEQSAVLDKLYNNFKLNKGTNNILVESENGVGLELDLSYMQDNNLLKEKERKDFNDRITTLENLLSTTQTSALLLDNLQSDLESEVN